jgi:catechol 2,3-dioxygenase-like lactoylglutathione lyase family enzyme
MAAVAAVRQGRVPGPEVTVAWLAGVARHKLADHWRRTAREQRGLAAVAVLAEDADDPRGWKGCTNPSPARPPPSGYFVSDLDAAVAFYADLLGFDEELRPSLAFAMLYRGGLRLLLSVPGGGQGGGAPMPDGTLPEPGGWNRIALQTEDLPAAVEELRGKGAFPQRHRHRRGRPADPDRGPLRQPHRVVRAAGRLPRTGGRIGGRHQPSRWHPARVVPDQTACSTSPPYTSGSSGCSRSARRLNS